MKAPTYAELMAQAKAEFDASELHDAEAPDMCGLYRKDIWKERKNRDASLE